MLYEIQISEEQRQIMLEWSEKARLLQAPSEEGYFLIGMLNCLPAHEAEAPGALHSFVL